jgi:hypothetical protein
MEDEGRRSMRLMPGAVELGRWLQYHNIPTALITRNVDRSVSHLHAELWEPQGLSAFTPAITREGPHPHKPDPAALAHIFETWGVAPGPEVLMVGDSLANDVAMAQAAGASTAYLDVHGNYSASSAVAPDVVVTRLADLPKRIHDMFEIQGPLGSAIAPGALKYPKPIPGGEAAAAARDGNAALLQSIAAGGGMVDGVDESGNTPLIWAADGGHTECVALLLESGVDANVRGYLGATAVSRACRHGHIDVLTILLALVGIDPDRANTKMQAPLHFAAFNRHRSAVQLMLASGASPWTIDRKGRTPAEDTKDASIRADIVAAQAARLQPTLSDPT